MRNLSGKKRNRSSRKKADQALAMEIANAADAFVAPSPYQAALSFIPNKQKVTMRYAQKVRLTSTATATQVYIFSANGAYDPDISGTGHQPRGFDQYMTMYDHCQVIGSKMRISFQSASNSSIVGVSLRDNAATPSSYLDYLEANPHDTTFTMTASQQEPHHLSLPYSQKKFFGTGELEDIYNGNVAANPIDQAYYHIFITDTDDLNGTVVDVLVVIDYICILTEPRTPPQS